MPLNYADINSRALNQLLSVKRNTPSIDHDLKALVELRVSQINGCAYCIDLHTTEARNLNVPQQKIDCLSVSVESGLFSPKESLALNWAECVTNISVECDRDAKLDNLLEHFSEPEVVDLTIVISLMNCLNRLSISFGDKPISRANSVD